jgi:hypothetical protein
MTLKTLPAQADLAEIQWLLNDPASRQEIARAISQLLKEGRRLGELRITRAKYKPGGKLRAFFDAPVYAEDGALEQVRPIAVTWQSPGQSPEEMTPDNRLLEEAEAEIFRRDLAGPFDRLWMDDPSRGMHIQVWPLDPDFSQIVRLSDPVSLRKILSRPDVPGGDWEVNPVRYRPEERHVLRLRRLGGENPTTLYAKLYRHAEGASRAYRIANQVVDWLHENVEGVTGVRPWGWLEPEAAVLYPHAPGTPLSSLLGDPGVSLSDALGQVGQALQALHQSPGALAPDLKLNPLEQEVRLVNRATQHVQAFLPAVGEEIRQSLDQILEASTALPGEDPTFTHSDFKADHLLVNPEAITIIDFDTCAIADPALDVGKFTADLEWWFVQSGQAGAEQAQANFLQGYGRGWSRGSSRGNSSRAPLERLARARLYKALILIKITARRARLYDPDWTRLVTRLVQRARDILRQPDLLNSKQG